MERQPECRSLSRRVCRLPSLDLRSSFLEHPCAFVGERTSSQATRSAGRFTSTVRRVLATVLVEDAIRDCKISEFRNRSGHDAVEGQWHDQFEVITALAGLGPDANSWPSARDRAGFGPQRRSHEEVLASRAGSYRGVPVARTRRAVSVLAPDDGEFSGSQVAQG
jgi:hypothetical protein